MNRRAFLAGGLVSLSTLTTSVSVQADEYATPVPTPTTRIPGARDEVYRQFKLASAGFDTMMRGQPNWLNFDVLEFSSTADAKDGIPLMRDNIRLGWRNGSDVSYRFGNPEPVSIRAMGDESHAWAVSMVSPDDNSILAIVLARSMNVLFSVDGTVENGNPYGLMAKLLADMLARRSTTGSISVDADGLHHGRLWDYLPTLADVPEGYAFRQDAP